MITTEEKSVLYSCIIKQFPDAGLYRVSRVNEWLCTNGHSVEEMGYDSFRSFAEDFPEVFGFQDDNNDEFIEIKKWHNGTEENNSDAHPADNFFGSPDIILNDDIIEMSQRSLYALTKILGNGLTVQEMKQEIYDQFEQAKSQNKLTFSAERYTFPIGYCRDGAQVNGLITKNINSYGKSLYFAFEKTHIYSAYRESDVKKARQGSIPDAEKEKIYKMLTTSYPCEQEMHMATISKFLSDHGIDRIRYGYAKMKDLIADLGYVTLTEVMMNGVPQYNVTIHAKNFDTPPMTQPVQRPYFETISTPAYSNNTPPVNTYSAIAPPINAYSNNHQFASPYGGNPQPATAFAPPICAERLSDICNLSNKAIDILQNYLMKKGFTDNYFEIVRELNEDYNKARIEGKIKMFEGKMVFPIRYLKEDNTNIELTLKLSDYGDKKWYLNYVDFVPHDKIRKPINPGKQLENFAFLGSWSNFLAELAAKAIDEEWDFPNSKYRSHQILIQYIKYTFSRLLRENKVCISSDREFAAFNTGLADKHYDDIYACFVPNDPGSDTEWKFTGFCTAASGVLGKQLIHYFSPKPEPPSYFSRNEDLFYDHTKALETDFDHIIIDNIKRLPLRFLYDQFYGDDASEARGLVDEINKESDRFTRDALYERLKEIINNDSHMFMRIQNRIEHSIKLAQKRVRWNYKIAVPSYYPKRDSMSLMLPLALVDESKPDVALVVELTPAGSYIGQTILTLAQAYIDARLMCRLTGDWLIPEKIVADSETPDEELADIE